VIVPIRSLVTREQPRVEKVECFAQMLRSGSKPPPIRVMKYADAASGNGDKRRWFVYDGHHRIAAARREGATHVAAELVSLT
jgi:hypothetical protein